MDEELVDIIDESGRFLRTALKTDAHKHGWLHATTIGQLRYGKDWALVRQAAHRQDPGLLVSPVGGHVRVGEGFEEALIRECGEELGIKNMDYKLIGQAVFRRRVIGRDENHLFVLYEIFTDDKFNLNHEVASVESFSTAELKKALASNPKDFGDAWFFVVEYFYPQLLPKNYKYRWKKHGTG